TPQQAVVAAYQEFWRVWLEANNPPNPDYPKLTEVDTGAQLTLARTAIEKHRNQGVVYRSASPSHADHQLLSLVVTGPAATLPDCSVDDTVVLDRSSGRVVNDDVVTHLWRVSLVLEGGQWKVQDNTETDRFNGISDCGFGSLVHHSA